MTESLKIYGFGSFFAGEPNPRDIDLLLLHRSTDRGSCQFAVACKALIKTLSAAADVVILAQDEAASLRFFDHAKTVLLGEVRFDHARADTVDILEALPDFPARCDGALRAAASPNWLM